VLRVIADQYNRDLRRKSVSKILDRERFKTLDQAPKTSY
jgi:hypothetical protein